MWSFRYASISAGFGGSPVRSSATRRISVRRSACGAGARALRFQPRQHEPVDRIPRPGRVLHRRRRRVSPARLNAQCSFQGAPCSIQRFSKSICAGVRLLCEYSGGIRLAGFVVLMRWYSRLASDCPGPRRRRACAPRAPLPSGPGAGPPCACRIRAVALEAVFRENRPDLALKVNRLVGGHGRQQKQDGRWNNRTRRHAFPRQCNLIIPSEPHPPVLSMP